MSDSDSERLVKYIPPTESSAKDDAAAIKAEADKAAAAEKAAADAKAAEEAAAAGKSNDTTDYKKSYDELRRLNDRQVTEFKREIDGLKGTMTTLTESFSKATAKKITPEEFQQRGNEIVEETIQERLAAERKAWDSKWVEQEERNRDYETKLEVATRQHNPSYPDWVKLQPTMQQIIMNDPECDPKAMRPGDILDYAYRKARELKLPGARESLLEEAKIKAEKQLEEEARAASDGSGGKKGVADTRSIEEKVKAMSTADAKAYVRKLQEEMAGQG